MPAATWQESGVETGRAFNTALEALHARRYAEARTALAELDLERLTPYERSKTEQMLFSISSAEGDDASARDHLLRALDAGGLNAQETRGALEEIRSFDARLPADSR